MGYPTFHWNLGNLKKNILFEILMLLTFGQSQEGEWYWALPACLSGHVLDVTLYEVLSKSQLHWPPSGRPCGGWPSQILCSGMLMSSLRKQGKRHQDRVALATLELDVVNGFILRTALLKLKQTMHAVLTRGHSPGAWWWWPAAYQPSLCGSTCAFQERRGERKRWAQLSAQLLSSTAATGALECSLCVGRLAVGKDEKRRRCHLPNAALLNSDPFKVQWSPSTARKVVSLYCSQGWVCSKPQV